MLEFQKKKKLRKILYSPIVLLLLAIIFILLFRGVWGVYKKNRLSVQNLEQERNELERFALREKNLAASLDYLKTDQGIESEIRAKFRVVKEGEQVAVIIDGQATGTAQTATTTRGFWYRLFHWFQI
ncbi:MAG: septum formation initiator family protein [Patescibacteria group bacterium]